MAKEALYVAKANGFVVFEGRRVMLRKGVTLAREGHPILKSHGGMFELVKVHYDVEQATAAPGERRSLSLPKSKRAEDEKGDE